MQQDAAQWRCQVGQSTGWQLQQPVRRRCLKLILFSVASRCAATRARDKARECGRYPFQSCDGELDAAFAVGCALHPRTAMFVESRCGRFLLRSAGNGAVISIRRAGWSSSVSEMDALSPVTRGVVPSFRMGSAASFCCSHFARGWRQPEHRAPSPGPCCCEWNEGVARDQRSGFPERSRRSLHLCRNLGQAATGIQRPRHFGQTGAGRIMLTTDACRWSKRN